MIGKRLFDIMLAALGLVAAAPVMLLVAVAIRTTMGKPIFFAQARAGLGGRPFQLVKFRTMHDLRDDGGSLLADELRLTRLGRGLRRTRIDELPELWQVLTGHMSLVGPRPLPLTDALSHPAIFHQRCTIRPGLTGWAQVNGNTRLTFDEKIALDLWYVYNRSLLLDLAILMRTLLVVIGGEHVHKRHLETALRHAYGSDRRY